MESRTILITLGVFAGLAILFQGASSATSISSMSVSRGGGTCNEAKDCCGAQNCHVINCNNSQQFNLIVIKGVNAGGCDKIANNLKLAGVIAVIVEATGLANAGPCGKTILNSVTAVVGANNENVQCCNAAVNNGIGGLLGRGDSSNCNNVVNECTAACSHQGGGSGSNQCNSNCCTIQTC